MFHADLLKVVQNTAFELFYVGETRFPIMMALAFPSYAARAKHNDRFILHGVREFLDGLQEMP